MSITKKVNDNEFEILKQLYVSNSEICPKILCVDEQHKLVTFEKYDHTLSDFIDKINQLDQLNQLDKNIIMENIKCKLKYLINMLHSCGIIHGDLHPSNIVVNTNNFDKPTELIDITKSNITKIDIRIIDFGISSKFENVDSKKLRLYGNLYLVSPVLKNLNDLKKWEIQCIDTFFY